MACGDPPIGGNPFIGQAPCNWILGPEVIRELQKTGPIVPDGGGLRFNEGKIPLELIPPEVELALGRTLQAGARKYGLRNWEKGMSWLTVVGCLRRHLNKWMAGKDIDDGPDGTGCTHLELVLINAAFLVTYEARRIGTDDRPKLETK